MGSPGKIQSMSHSPGSECSGVYGITFVEVEMSGLRELAVLSHVELTLKRASQLRARGSQTEVPLPKFTFAS